MSGSASRCAVALLFCWACDSALDLPERGLAPNVVCSGGKCECSAPWRSCGDGGLDCTTDIQTDSQHCGDCGRDCMGGACVNARCQPTVIAKANDDLPAPLAATMEIAADDELVYLAFDDVIASVPWRPDGGSVDAPKPQKLEGLAAGSVRDLKWHAGTLWWLQDNAQAQVCRVETPISGPASCQAISNGSPVRIAVVDASNAWMTSESAEIHKLTYSNVDPKFSAIPYAPVVATQSAIQFRDVIADDERVFVVGKSSADEWVAGTFLDPGGEASIAAALVAKGVAPNTPLGLSESHVFYYLAQEGTARGELAAQERNGSDPLKPTRVALLRDLALIRDDDMLMTSSAGALSRVSIVDGGLVTALEYAEPERSFSAVVVRQLPREGSDPVDVALFFELVNNELLRLPLYPH